MGEKLIRVVVPERVKNSKYSEAPNVISYRDFFREHVEPSLQRWKKQGFVIGY